MMTFIIFIKYTENNSSQAVQRFQYAEFHRKYGIVPEFVF